MSGGQMEIHGRIENWQRVKALLFQDRAGGSSGSDREEDEGNFGALLNADLVYYYFAEFLF